MCVSAMDRVGFCILAILTTILVQVNSDRNVLHSTNTPTSVHSVSGFALEMILNKHDFLVHKFMQLREEVQEQRESHVKNQEKSIQTLELLLTQNTESLQAIANIQDKQKQSFDLMDKVQGEMEKQRKETTKDREEFVKWKAEHTESQQAIANIQDKQKQSFDLLSKVQGEMEKQRIEATKNGEEFAKWKTETGAMIATIQIESIKRQKDVLDGIATNLGEQEEIRRKQEQNVKSLDSITQTLAELKSTLSAQGAEAKKNQNETGNHMDQLERDHKQLRNKLLDIQLGSYRSCNDVPMKVSGKYKIRVNEKSDPFDAYCDASSSGDSRMVIQWRKDGSQNFNRNWTDYKNGFGNVKYDHWLGLERIHQYTKENNCELHIQLKDFNGTFKWAKYDSFAIGSEAEGYNLKTLGAYSGTAGDSLSHHKGMKFSTPDRDNDNHADLHCAKAWKGGWWFNACYHAFLNGEYRNVSGVAEWNIGWYTFQNDYRGLSYSRMMIRPLN